MRVAAGWFGGGTAARADFGSRQPCRTAPHRRRRGRRAGCLRQRCKNAVEGGVRRHQHPGRRHLRRRRNAHRGEALLHRPRAGRLTGRPLTRPLPPVPRLVSDHLPLGNLRRRGHGDRPEPVSTTALAQQGTKTWRRTTHRAVRGPIRALSSSPTRPPTSRHTTGSKATATRRSRRSVAAGMGSPTVASHSVAASGRFHP